MASVTSLDADMRNLRLARYTPQAAAEARAWIEKTLGNSLATGDLLDALKDGVALCQLANLAIQPQHGAIKYKASSMPFIQMENISHFLKACEMAPLSLPAHDRFLTVDLFEQKDPAQVLQCLGAFSRQANRINPARFPNVIGPKKAGTSMSPTNTGGIQHGAGWRRAPSPTKASAPTPAYGTQSLNPALTGGSNGSQRASDAAPKSPPTAVSSWSKKSDESSTAPAWNIFQYGYLGGASQGNQGVSFGARRQITSQAPTVPTQTTGQRVHPEREAEVDRLRQHDREEHERRQRAAEEEERNAKIEEDRRWEEETKRVREEERRQIESQKREWEEQERKWKEDEEIRSREEASLQASVQKKPPEKPRVPSSSILRGQTLSEWQRESAALAKGSTGTNSTPSETPEQKRVRELEKQLEEARERERRYQAEREERLQNPEPAPSRASIMPQNPTAQPRSSRESEASWAEDEGEHLRRHQQSSREDTPAKSIPTSSGPSLSSGSTATHALPHTPPLAQPANHSQSILESTPPALPSRLHSAREQESQAFAPEERQPNRTDRFLATNAAPSIQGPRISSSREAGDTSLEQSQLRDSRLAGQQRTKAAAWASKSLLEREMERERERQREWEASQEALRNAPRDTTQGVGVGQSWDPNQYGYIHGDNMNRGSSVGSGINIGGRRQIVGPRPQPQ